MSPGIDIQPTSSPKKRPRNIPAKTPIRTLVERDRFFTIFDISFYRMRFMIYLINVGIFETENISQMVL